MQYRYDQFFWWKYYFSLCSAPTGAERRSTKKRDTSCDVSLFPRARDGTRTRGPDLGKVVLHQLSHSRIGCCVGHVCQTHLISYNRSYNLSTLNLKYLCRLKRYEETSTRSGAKKLGRKHDA